MEKSYKVIDGVLYNAVDTTEIKKKIADTVEKVKPYKVGIEGLKRQEANYENQISAIIANADLDADIVRAIDPENAVYLGL